jgi:hypothetical protein
MLQPALFGGLFIGVLSALPVVNIGNCCCLWFTGGGFLAAYLAQQNDPNKTITLGRGALAGLVAAIAGAFVWLIVNSLVQLALGPALQEWSYDLLQNPDVPPALREALEDFAENGTSPLATAFSFLFQLGVGGIFATLGGLGGAAYFRRDNVPPALGGPPSPPPPPSEPPAPPSPPPPASDGWTP